MSDLLVIMNLKEQNQMVYFLDNIESFDIRHNSLSILFKNGKTKKVNRDTNDIQLMQYGEFFVDFNTCYFPVSIRSK